jgi:hypothetical protein
MNLMCYNFCLKRSIDLFIRRWLTARKGFNCSQTPPPRRDFALFVTLQPVGSNAGSWSDSNKESESAGVYTEESCKIIQQENLFLGISFVHDDNKPTL